MVAPIEIPVGERFGELVVTGRAPRPKNGTGCWVFARCDCGNEKRYRLRSLRGGNSHACGLPGHFDREIVAKGDAMIGERFGALVVAASTTERGTGRGAQVLVRCDCGAERYARITDLRGGGLQSCNGDAHKTLKPQAKRWEVRGKKGTYAIEGVGTGLVKIGMARDIKERMLKLQPTSPVELRLIASSEDDVERKLHALLDGHRAHGEWFHANDVVMGAIASELEPASMSVIAECGRAGTARGSQHRCKRCGDFGHHAKTCSKPMTT